MDISIIIVNFNSLTKTLRCIESIKKSDFKSLSYEIIVVDNNSSEADISVLKNQYPGVTLLKSEINLGMGGGNNFGARQARGEFIVILNPDTYLNDLSLFRLYDYLKNHSEAGLAAPKLLYPDGSLQYTCLRFPKFYLPLIRRTFFGKFAKEKINYFTMSDFDHMSIKEVDWVQGSCFMVKTDLFNKVGGFDERYFMYFEDTDFCRKIWNEGYKVIYLPEAVVVHDHSRESAEGKWFLAPFTNRLAREHIKSWIKYFIKWGFK